MEYNTTEQGNPAQTYQNGAIQPGLTQQPAVPQQAAVTQRPAVSPPHTGQQPGGFHAQPGFSLQQGGFQPQSGFQAAQPGFQPPQAPYPPYAAAPPPSQPPRGYKSNLVFALGIVTAVFLTATFTVGLILGLNRSLFSAVNSEQATRRNAKSWSTENTNEPADTAVASSIQLDGLKITLEPGADAKTEAQAAKLAEMIDIIQQNYFSELSSAEILEAIIQGLPEKLGSPYSYYMSAEEYASMKEASSGHYSGIGAKITQTAQGQFELIDITPSSPAEAAGLQPGDLIVEVEGKEASQYPSPGALAADVRGPEGSKVRIKVFRPLENKSFELELVRRSVNSVYVTHKMLDGKIAYIAISEFATSMPEQFEEALKDLVYQGAQKFVFDLRNNPGGDAAAVQQVLDMLLPAGELASVKGRENGEEFEEVWTSEDGQLVPQGSRFTVLINNNSASASELFSGCLRDRVQTKLIGENTFGKGSGTRFYLLPDGSAVNVTIFLYYLPGGETPEGEGLKPDIEISLPDEARGKVISRLSAEEDTQLAEAISVLTGP